jgi:hypothetical protein
MSLRVFEKQLPHLRGGCFAKYAVQRAHTFGSQRHVNVAGIPQGMISLPALRKPRRSLSGCTSERLQSQTQEELDALRPSVLRPSGEAFKGEL